MKNISEEQIYKVLNEVYNKYKNVTDGAPASYIPELARVDAELFAISITNVEGKTYHIGEVDKHFTMQSTSKPLMYGLALKAHGSDFVHSKVGVEPTGEAFNSIIELEEKSHRPFNPMINSGAIATTSLVTGESFAERFQNIKKYFELFVGSEINVDEKVYHSEKMTAHRNRAIAYLMKHFDVMEADIEETLDLYFKQCSLLINCRDLSQVAATYANYGKNPVSKKTVQSATDVAKTLSLMFTCGMYDSSGEWAFSVGMPAKSGVSGAVFAVSPGRLGVAAFSPRIDSRGHSIRAQSAIKDLSDRLKLNIFQLGAPF